MQYGQAYDAYKDSEGGGRDGANPVNCSLASFPPLLSRLDHYQAWIEIHAVTGHFHLLVLPRITYTKREAMYVEMTSMSSRVLLASAGLSVVAGCGMITLVPLNSIVLRASCKLAVGGRCT